MIDLPRVNPVGVTEIPDDFSRRPRTQPFILRCIAAALALILLAVILHTGSASLAIRCLTSQAGAPFPFQ